MGKYRKRFNEKARAGMVAKQQELKRTRQKSIYRGTENESAENVKQDENVLETVQDPNAELLVPLSKQELEDRKRKLQEALKRHEPGISSKKRKRLDKYIEKQVTKQEKEELLEKLSKSNADTSMLKSLKTLGSRTATKREKFQEALELEQNGLGNEESKHMIYEEREVKDWRTSEEFSNYSQPQLQTEAKPDEVEEEEIKIGERASSFIDHRPQGEQGSGFGFEGIIAVSKKMKPGISWRERLDRENARKHKVEYEPHVNSSDFEESKESDSSDEEQSDQGSWYGFSDFEDVEELQQKEEEEFSDQNGIDDEVEDIESEPEDEEEESVDEDEESEGDDDGAEENGKSKGQSFKEWASKSNSDERMEIILPPPQEDYVPLERPEDRESPPPEKNIPSNNLLRKSYYVNVIRPDEVQESRLQLPIVAEEQRIMDAIHNSECIVICGETGSGKTTQVPQFLYEAGYGSTNSETPGMIGITQPRRVAAVSMAKRVSVELGNEGHRVGYQIRFDAMVNADTAVKFMTDGVLLRELATDFTLSKYSAIIIDEAHERNINTDILIGVLSRVLKLRKDMSEENKDIKPLKLIIMSATLRVSDFTENSVLFPIPPPVISVSARQFPVSIHFDRRTHYNYIDQVYKKAVKIHQRLPPGGILIFLTGQNEILTVCKKLRKAFPVKKQNVNSSSFEARVRVLASEAITEAEDINFGVEEEILDHGDKSDNDYEHDEEEEGFDETLEDGQNANAPLHVLPLYSLLPTKEQLKVFETPPEGSRLCVVSTNVAETSLTIPGIRYVVDCGRVKERNYDESTGVQSFRINWASKASADQRAGRAGRTGPGHCYRIFSSALYENDFDQFTKPEILRMPIEGVILQMKTMGIHNILNFPFPTPPSRIMLDKGLKLLKYLGALDISNESVTELGKTMSLFPLAPRFSKMLVIGNQADCLPFVIAVVAALTVGDPFITELELGLRTESESNDKDREDNHEIESVEDNEFRRKLRANYFQARQRLSGLDANSDALKLLCAVCAYDYDKNPEEFCKSNFLRYKMMDEISKLRKQVAYLVAANTRPESIDKTVASLDQKLKPPTTKQVKALKQMITAGFIDQIAVRADIIEDISTRSKSNIISYPYVSLFPPVERMSKENIDPHVFIHPSSILTSSNSKPPDYLVYQSINLSQRSSSMEDDEEQKATMAKVRMKPLTDISAAHLANIAKSSSLITYSKPLGPPYAPQNLTHTRRQCWVVPRFGAAIGTGGVGWDLPVIKVIQEKDGTQWVVK